MTVPVRATSCTEPFEKTYSPLSAMPSVLSSVLERGGKAHVSALVQVIRGV